MKSSKRHVILLSLIFLLKCLSKSVFINVFFFDFFQRHVPHSWCDGRRQGTHKRQPNSDVSLLCLFRCCFFVFLSEHVRGPYHCHFSRTRRKRDGWMRTWQKSGTVGSAYPTICKKNSRSRNLATTTGTAIAIGRNNRVFTCGTHF